jgi:uncharacterized protein
MIWVGAEIIAHGIPFTNQLLHDLEHSLTTMPVAAWLAKALACLIAGLILGFIIEKLVVLFKKIFFNKKKTG